MLNIAKVHGGKGTPRLNNWIRAHLPPEYKKLIYLEGYAGSASILLNKAASSFEAINDISYENVAMLRAARGRSIGLFKYDRKTFDYYKFGPGSQPTSDLEYGKQEYVLRNMSRGGMKKTFAWSERKRRNMPGDISGFLSKQAKLDEIADRLRYVEIYNLDALDFLRKFNFYNSFAYLDPPYLLATRTAKKVYDHEMTMEQHRDLLEFLLNEWKGLFLLSGYESNLYTPYLQRYKIDRLAVSNSSGQGKTKQKRVECLWFNY